MTQHQSLADYAKTADVDKKLEGYYTKEEVDSAIEDVDVSDQLKDYATKAEVTSEVNSAIDSLVNGASTTMDTLKELEDAISGNKNLIDTLNSAITSKADRTELEDMATKTWVNQQNYLTEVPEDYAKKTDIPSLEGYAKSSEVTTAIEEALGWAEY